MQGKAASETAGSNERELGRARFELLRDRNGHIRFRYVSPNGEVVFRSGGYTSKSEALKAIDSVKRGVGTASVAENRPTLISHILSGPDWPEEMYEAVNRRSKASSRPPIDF
ncbi:DUF1508 domain-containing protein [Aquamicrobium sp. LC103]|nr:DUF1508 domain-containing protein [Aquamicrobium sp. LC103]TKT82971.1 DUF1508 domain-containing protein [Aquamicrobium sp. LC103]